jgi:hypothetical protein
MKQKKSTYFLGAAVLVIWGMIIYRTVDAASDKTPPTIDQIPAAKTPFNDYSLKEDTTRLLLNYSDPFRLSKDQAKDTAFHKIKPEKLTNSVKSSTPEMNWNFVKYAGYVANPGQKRTLALVFINGKSVLLAEGETADDIKLIKNMRDSIKIKFRKKTKIITRSTGS